MGLPNRKVVFQPSIFGCYVSLREGKCSVIDKGDYLSAIKAIFGGVNLWTNLLIKVLNAKRRCLDIWGCSQFWWFFAVSNVEIRTKIKNGRITCDITAKIYLPFFHQHILGVPPRMTVTTRTPFLVFAVVLPWSSCCRCYWWKLKKTCNKWASQHPDPPRTHWDLRRFLGFSKKCPSDNEGNSGAIGKERILHNPKCETTWKLKKKDDDFQAQICVFLFGTSHFFLSFLYPRGWIFLIRQRICMDKKSLGARRV